MQNIYIAKPGGQKEGPFTLEQINRDLAFKRINDTDFWAWHEGLPSWMPLHSVPGVSATAKAAVVAAETKPQPIAAKATPEPTTQVKPQPIAAKPQAAVAPSIKPEPVALKVEAPITSAPPTTETARATAPVSPQPVAAPQPCSPRVEAAPTVEVQPGPAAEPKPPEIRATPSMSSGKPFAALEQIFVFSTGEGPSAFKSEITTAMISEAVGERLEIVRSKVPVDVIGGANASVLETIRDGSIPGSAWRALFKIKPAVAQQIQNGAYHLCVRTFPVESKELVALFLLYNKQSQ